MNELLPKDCTRCVGVSNDEGELAHPCNTCKRVLWARPAPKGSVWVIPPRDRLGRCHLHWHIDMGET